ncbi:hypothetical protein IMZ31_17210 [Pontibacillus sp. ALD_SL1]|uniref:lipopolysaccharide biosynthesis protein n=1 Tax=Pontibacillus sp. ALD_SL1 TaxID=2777185 RepID=UPI001A9617B6|nr:hypothetical protein [Pontibacillus sp. ALD_SL1]QSS99779.1 hypothetical protein IMZ31_17210 [Pontibacillus sp. ALD_SL1]
MYKKILSDSILNIIAAAVPILLLQLIILPVVGGRLGEEEYGIAITVISMATLFSLPFGNVLNNIRLLMNQEYKKNDAVGDFKILLTISILLNTTIMIIGTIYFEKGFSFISVLLVILFSGLNLLREYLIVSFRITINYKAILVNNIVLSFGYLIGVLFFYFIGFWQLIYVFGASFSLIYIIRNSNLITEPFAITGLFKKTTYKSVVLFLSVLMKTILMYADKLLIFPLLGPAAVSVYYSATLMGKIISMAITPISGVILSYLTKVEKVNNKNFLIIMLLTVIMSIVGYGIIIFISEPILNLLYPKWAQSSLDLIYITTATAIMGVISSIIHPFLLTFQHINWQLFINAINLIVYIICIMVFYNLYDLIGFCIGMLIASVIKILIMLAVYFMNTLPISEKV